MLNWFNRNKKKPIPDKVKDELFYMASGECSDAELSRVKFFIDTYSIEQVDRITKWGMNPLMTAMDLPDDSGARFAQLMFASGSDLSLRSKEMGFSVLLAATKNSAHLDILRTCLITGSDPNERMGNSDIGFVNSALGLAVTWDNTAAVELLIEAGADAAKYDNIALRMWTSGCFDDIRLRHKVKNNLDAYLENKENILVTLLEAGAQINMPSKNNISFKTQLPVEHCLTYGGRDDPIAEKFIEMLIKHGAQPKRD